MKCPNCEHVTDAVTHECASCGQAYDRTEAEHLEHLQFLMSWLGERSASLAPDAYEALRRDATDEVSTIRKEFKLEPPAPKPYVEVKETAEERAARVEQLALTEVLLAQIDPWCQSAKVGRRSYRAMSEHLYETRKELRQGLDDVEVEHPDELKVVEFGLQKVDEWERQGIVSGLHLERFLNFLIERRAGLLGEAEPVEVPAQPKAVPVESRVVPPKRKPVRPPKPVLPKIDWGKAWERTWNLVVSGVLLQGLLYLGAFMIVVAALVLVVAYWDLFPTLLQLGFIAALPVSFYLAGYLLRVRFEIPVAGAVFSGIGALLVAVDFAAVYQFGGLSDQINVNTYWLAASVFCSIVYGVTVRRLPTQFMAYITLVAFSSVVLAFTTVLALPIEWRIAALVAAMAAMVAGRSRLQQLGAGAEALRLASLRWPQIVAPIALAAVLFVPAASEGIGPAFGQAATFALASLTYGLLAWHQPARRHIYAATAASVFAFGFAMSAVTLPRSWYPAAAGLLAPIYLITGTRPLKRLPESISERTGYPLAASIAGFFLIAVGGTGGIGLSAAWLTGLQEAFWPGIIALVLVAGDLGLSAVLFRQPAFVLASSGLFVLPYSLTLGRWLTEIGAAEPGVWLMAAWAALALVYIGLGTASRRFVPITAWVIVTAHLLTPLALMGLVVNSVGALFSRSSSGASPELATLSIVVLNYAISAALQDGGAFPRLDRIRSKTFSPVIRSIFLWPVSLLTPIWLALVWSSLGMASDWLGSAFVALAAIYVGLGERLARRRETHRTPFHIFAYVLVLVGVLTAIGDRPPLLTALLLGVAVFAGLSYARGRVIDATLAAVLFLWPFSLILSMTELEPRAYILAYMLLAAIVYFPIGIHLGRLGDRKDARIHRGTPLIAIALLISFVANAVWIVARIVQEPGSLSWIFVAVPLITSAMYIYGLFQVRRSAFAWLATAALALAYGQVLALVEISESSVALAWVGLAYGLLALERLLARAGSGEPRWFSDLGRPLLAFVGGLGVLSAALSAPLTIELLQGGSVAVLPLIAAQVLVAALTVVASAIFRVTWPLFLEPWLAIVPLTVLFRIYSEQLFGAVLPVANYAILLASTGLVHLAIAAYLDDRETRYSRGLYVGAYGMMTLGVLWAPSNSMAFVLTFGMGILALSASAILVHSGRHQTWGEVSSAILKRFPGRLEPVIRQPFLWIASWLFPFWLTLLLVALGALAGIANLGFVVGALLLLGLGIRLERADQAYRWACYSAAQAYTLLGLAVSLPTTTRILFGQVPGEALAGSELGAIAVQATAVAFYVASAVVFQRRLFSWLAAWLSIVPTTLVWLVSGTAEISLAWLAWASVLLLVGFLLDPLKTRFAHGPYSAGYILSILALIWSVSDPETNLYTLLGTLVIAVFSQILVHRGRHYTYRDSIRLLTITDGTLAGRVANSLFLFYFAYGFPVWLVRILNYRGVPTEWLGMSLALLAPLYIAAGLRVRWLHREYAWPFFSAGYALTALGAMLSFADLSLSIYVLSLNALVFAASAYIFRQAIWLYLTTLLIPVIFLLAFQNQFGSLPSGWVSISFMLLSFVYLGIGRALDWLLRAKAVSRFALPFYIPAFLLSAIAVAVATDGRDLAIVVFGAAVALYGLSAWLLQESVFLYPAAWLFPIPYFLAITLTPLDTTLYGIALLPLLTIYLIVGRTVFDRGDSKSEVPRPVRQRLSEPATPFYLGAYALSVGMLVLSRSDARVFAASWVLASLIYFASAATFRNRYWLYPALLSGHVALLTYISLGAGGNLLLRATLSMLGAFWLVALSGYVIARRTVSLDQDEAKLRLGRFSLRLPASPAVVATTSPSWASPFFQFALLDVVVWQAIALSGFETTLIFATGAAVLLGLLASLWGDRYLPYLSLGYALIAIIVRLAWAELSPAEVLAALGGLGFALYLLSRAIHAAGAAFPRFGRSAFVWVKPTAQVSAGLASFAAIATLPALLSQPTTTAATWAFAGALAVTIAYREKRPRLGFLGLGMLLLAWIVLLVSQQIALPQLYAIPAGLYFIFIGHLEYRRAPSRYPIIIESLGMAVLLVTTFAQSLDPESGFIYFGLLLAEAIAIGWWGAARRLKTPFFVGLGAIALAVIAQLIVLMNTFEGQLNRWALILAVGLVLVTTAVLVERSRERIIERAQEWRDDLQTWA